MDADVIIVGAGPTGLMLAGELRLAGVRPVVLEQHAQRRDIPKAGGLGGQILELLRYRGLLERYEAACPGPAPAPRFPFGGVHVDLTSLQDPPMHALPLPQPQLEQLLEERARELDVDIRRGQQVVGVSQDEAGVTVDARCPEGTRQLRARYVVGCDGARSRVRDLGGFAFPGTTYPEVNRLAQVTLPEAVTTRADGGLDLPGHGTIRPGFTRTDHGLFGIGASPTDTTVSLYTVEDETTAYDDYGPERLVIGKFCALGTGVRFIMNGANHRMDGPSTFPFPTMGGSWAGHFDLLAGLPNRGDTVVGNDVWFGFGATVMPGVRIGHGAIIAAGSVVTGDVPDYGVVGGNPARLIRTRYDERAISRLLAVAWWDWPIACITEHLRTIMSGSVEDLENAAPGHSVRPSHTSAPRTATGGR